jgi:transposase-like protein
VHETGNVLNKLPKSQQSKAKRALQEIWMAETKEDALVAFDAFETWAVKYDKAVECLIKIARCSRSTISRTSTGNLCAPPTSSKVRSQQSATLRALQRMSFQ